MLMNILFLATSLEEGQAGAAHHSVEFIKSLASRPKVRLTVLAESATQRLDPAARLLHYRWPPSLKALWRVESLFEIHRLMSELRRCALPKIDLCYTRSTSLGLAFRAIAPGVPIVSHLGSVVASRETFEETAGGDAKWHTRLSARLADQREAKSYAQEQWLHLVSTPMVAKVRESAHNLPANFFHVCPLGSNDQRFNRAGDHGDIRGALGIPHSAHVLISVARLVRLKNVDLVVRALASMRRSDTFLIVVGSGPELESLKQAAAVAGVTDRTRFVGQIANPAPYYAASNVFVLPSKIESFGNVYAEAMLMGLPCIGLRHQPPTILSSAEDVIPEAIAGFCIANLGELTERLNILAEDTLLTQELGENAYRHAIQNYTIERYTETVLRLARDNFGIE